MEPEDQVVEPQVDQEEPAEQEHVAEEATKDDNKEAEARRQITARAKAAEEKARKLEAELQKLQQNYGKDAIDEKRASLSVDDYIDITNSLQGLDPVEQAYLARQAKATGENLKDIRGGEDFQNWQAGYKAKQEKEAALKPNATQEVEDEPKSLTDALKGASLEEKERILAEAGLWKTPRPKTDRRDIGNKISTG